VDAVGIHPVLASAHQGFARELQEDAAEGRLTVTVDVRHEPES
jgi:hypothetical protein